MAYEYNDYDEYGLIEKEPKSFKKKSTTNSSSKSIYKSKHKHEYVVVGFKDNTDVNNKVYALGTICRYCGKIDQCIYYKDVEKDNGLIVSEAITKEDIGSAPIYDYEFGMKYVPIVQFSEEDYD